MARCGCQGTTCSCVIQGGGGVTVSGAGSGGNPYIISSDLNLLVADSPTIDLGISGDGSSGNPYVLTAAAALELGELVDVDTSVVTTGYVLARQADGTFKLVPPSTAAPGALTVGNGLQGDGSSGNPLGVKLAASSGLAVDASGLKLAGGSDWTVWTPTLTGSSSNPAIGNGSIEASYAQMAKIVHLGIEINIGSTTKRGVGAWQLSLPVPARASRNQVLPVQVSAVGLGDFVGIAKIETVSGVARINRIFLATSTAAQPLSHSVPAALGAGSKIIISGTYEAE